MARTTGVSKKDHWASMVWLSTCPIMAEANGMTGSMQCGCRLFRRSSHPERTHPDEDFSGRGGQEAGNEIEGDVQESFQDKAPGIEKGWR